MGVVLMILYIGNQRRNLVRTTQQWLDIEKGNTIGLPTFDSSVDPYAEKEKRDMNTTELPPFDSLVDPNSDTIVAKDIQWLLDFAIVGFSKSGSTTLLQWLRRDTLVRAPEHEIHFLKYQRPAQLIKILYQFALQEQEAQENKSIGATDKILKGFKDPMDIQRPYARKILAEYWPQTPLIVTVRHPVNWMVSFYNFFKIELRNPKDNLTVANMLSPGGRDEYGETQQLVSTAGGEFHAILAEIGKTPLHDIAEWKLLQPWLNHSEATIADIRQHRLPNPIFFMEMQQLGDSNTTRAKQFANDLEAFLGLPPNHLPPVLHVRPLAHRVKKRNTNHLKMDICATEHAPILQEMMAISRSASQWFQDYFIHSPEVTVSSPEYLLELLEGWKINPCASQSS